MTLCVVLIHKEHQISLACISGQKKGTQFHFLLAPVFQFHCCCISLPRGDQSTVFCIVYNFTRLCSLPEELNRVRTRPEQGMILRAERLQADQIIFWTRMLIVLKRESTK